MWKQWLIAVVVLAVAVGGGWAYRQWSSGERSGPVAERPAAAVNVVHPHRDTVRDEIHTVGSLKALRAVELTTEVSGRVVAIHLGAGRRVEQGELLLRLDDRQARADLAEVEAQLADARRQLERATRLRSNNSVSQSQVDALRTAVDVALAQRQAARVRLENHSIRAPFAGVVGLTDITVGAYVTAGTTITTLDATERMELAFAVPERFLGQVYPGQEVRGESPAFPDRPFLGELAELGTRVDELSRTLPVRALIDNHEGLLRPGQFLSASLTLARRQALVIPEQAVLVRGGDHYVFVAEDGVARRVSVTLGARMPGRVEVLTGLSEGDQVIVTGQDRLGSGDRVRILEGEPVLPDNRFLGAVGS
ncbi:efflux RND transporter periplasmic adaptor subunit [Marinobacter lutaoensis]|jgi:membrane fusion protein (multidrug efflux system)|uniref:efflux RND transporter periplasmic adaptor subunit n=1 Tax=Marinobacter lutaoensis TaxID=135739 RepID=UPI000C0B32B7|nr:efflux RND transporter periplasmic adaptor subunit [Marinobacter lutaoensis]MBE01990.1 efflux transporter periplasmic adaptor subunit [Marinobacter sp.]NVD36367.1 efflux RND transporter periplasmic adaptor subunit [Marinobacter lutaoensis]|tara:strand:+ start:1762 stop:2856 length:1095 start_codon:yes stop_codon:yes gene_type:complete